MLGGSLFTAFLLDLGLAFPLGCFGMSAVGLTWRIAAIRSSSVGTRVLLFDFGIRLRYQS